MRPVLSAPLILLAACSGDGGKDATDGTTPVDPFDTFVNVTEEVQGDFSCFTPVSDPGAAAWLTQQIDPALQATATLTGFVEDFEEGTAVPGATVALYTDDTVDTPDVTASSDANGDLSLDGPTCQPVTYKVTTEGGPIATRTTYKAHQVYPAGAGGTVDGVSFLSVSDVTYQLIPGILGVDIVDGLAIIAGTAFDCTRDPSLPTDDDSGKLEGVQVVVYDADGNIPDTLQVNYFVESFPARDQKWTSADGLWVASNVPPGELRVEMWGVVGGELVLLGATELFSEADAINISNIFSGYGDGVKYPASCETAR